MLEMSIVNLPLISLLGDLGLLSLIDTDTAGTALPRIIEILATEDGWDNSRWKQDSDKATEFLETFKCSEIA